MKPRTVTSSMTDRRLPSPRHHKVVLVIGVLLAVPNNHHCVSSLHWKPSFVNNSPGNFGRRQRRRDDDCQHQYEQQHCHVVVESSSISYPRQGTTTTALHLFQNGQKNDEKERNDNNKKNKNNPSLTTTNPTEEENLGSIQQPTSGGLRKVFNENNSKLKKTAQTASFASTWNAIDSVSPGRTDNDEGSTVNAKIGDEERKSDISQPEQEIDFSVWVEGLKQWPRYPAATSSLTTTVTTNDPLPMGSNVQGRPGGGTNKKMEVRESQPQIAGSVSDIDESSSSDDRVNNTRNVTSSVPSSIFPGALFSAIPALMREDGSISSTMSTSRKATLASSLESSPGRYIGINPLSNFIKFEAILDMAAGVNNETEPYFSNVVAAAEQLFKLSVTRDDIGENRNSVDGRASAIGLDGDIEKSSETEQVDELLFNATTVEELIQRERYFGSLPFRLDSVPRTSAARAAGTSVSPGGPKPSSSMVPTSSKSGSKLTTTANDFATFFPVTNTTSGQAGLAQAAESILKDATSRIEFLVSEASNVLSPSSVQELVIRASMVFAVSPNGTDTTSVVESVANEVVEAARRVAKDRGLDVQFAADRAREATTFAASMAAVANTVLGAGYAYGSRSGASGIEGYPLGGVLPQTQQGTLKPLFGDYASACRVEPFQYGSTVIKGAEMGALAGAIYENTLERCRTMGHSQVANGTTDNVAWMVTDSLDYRSRYDVNLDEKDAQKPIIVRTITIRGFDASDESVDREQLLNDVCTATAEPMDAAIPNAVFHKGLLSIARRLYADVKKYIDWTSPDHRIVLNGHSLGGSLSVLILLLITSERGADFTREKILRVFTHGSPPVAAIQYDSIDNSIRKKSASPYKDEIRCSILEMFGLPSTMVFGYIQPYDPVTRLFSEYDALYPLVDDLGSDDVTLYATGPRRSLRPITRAIFQAWSGWPRFRDNWKGTSSQRYQSVGVQHILLPEPLRYLNDRFLSTNVGVPPVEVIVRISSDELLPALGEMFPLDVFQISLIPQAVRSFFHHFYPAYDAAIVDYSFKVEKQTQDTGLV